MGDQKWSRQQRGAGLPSMLTWGLLISAGMLEYEPTKRFSIRQIRQHR